MVPSQIIRIVTCFFLWSLTFPNLHAAEESSNTPPPSSSPPTVSYIIAEATTIPLTYEYIGVTEPSKKIDIHARIRGYLEARLFKEGDVINEGALLYKIDSRSIKTDVEIASAQVEQAQSHLKLADRELQRLSMLREKGNATPSDYDRAETEYNNALASLRLAKANLAKAELELSYTSIYAPLTGLIGKTNKEPGSLVDDMGNSLLAQMTQLNPIYVSFHVSERDYLAWHLDAVAKRIVIPDGGKMHFQIFLQDGEIIPQSGSLTFEDPSFNPETGTSEFRAEFPNPQLILKAGQFVKIRMLGWVRPHSIAVPQKAINQIPSGTFVMVIGENNVTEFRKVTLGMWSGKEWIVLDGLQSGERIVVDSILKAQPGMIVNPVPFSENARQTDGDQ